jgi:hypothetical protein
MQPGSYVVPYRAREGPRQPIEGSFTEVPDDEDEVGIDVQGSKVRKG